MKKRSLILLALASLSCQPEVETGPEAGAGSGSESQEIPEAKIDVNQTDTLIGKPFDEVEPALEAAGIRHRVVERDGETFPVTMDYFPERLNFRLKDGVVIGVTKG